MALVALLSLKILNEFWLKSFNFSKPCYGFEVVTFNSYHSVTKVKLKANVFNKRASGNYWALKFANLALFF